MIGKINNFQFSYIHLHLLSKYYILKLKCRLIMMDNKIVIVGKKYDDGTKMIYLFFKKSFS
jgi:hypothetical protein